MTAIPSSLTPSITPAQPSSATPVNQPPQTTANAFGDAVNMHLSTPAQAALAASQSTALPGPASASSQNAKQAPVAAQSASAVDVAALIRAAKQKVIPLVGMSGASEVVDTQGNISKAKLAEVIVEQAQKG